MGQRLGTYLRQLREERGFSTHDVARQAGCSPAFLSLIERAKRGVTIEALYPIVRTLNGDMREALKLLALDAGVPKEELW